MLDRKLNPLISCGVNDTVLGNAQHYRAFSCVSHDFLRELLLEVAQKLATDRRFGQGKETALQPGQSQKEGSSAKLVEITPQIVMAEINCVLNIRMQVVGDHVNGSKSETKFLREEMQKTSESAKIFISYRRVGSSGYAGRVQDRLQLEFGSDLVFMDVDAIPLGVNFVKALHAEVARCGVLLAVIGPDWLDVRDDHGNRRLDDPNDFVRIEIAAALQRDIPVIPILLDGLRIPTADQLPDDLKELASRNALDVRHASFPSDMDKLVRALKAWIAPNPHPVLRSQHHHVIAGSGLPLAQAQF